MVDAVAKRLSMRTPPIFIIKTTSAWAYNAFASGPVHAISMIAIGQGLLETLTKAELEGVIARELAHVKGYHILKRALALAALNVTGHYITTRLLPTGYDKKTVAQKIAFVISVNAAKVLGLLAVSRYQEKDADLRAAAVIENPRVIGTALETMHTEMKKHRGPLTRWFSNKFKWFHLPLPTVVKRLLSTHPLTKDRMKYLDDYATQQGK
jgi:heat shock protein HtpX